jgi:hypothetical protein
MDHTPQPAGHRADEPLLEIPPDHLKQEGAAFYEVLEEMPAGEAH